MRGLGLTLITAGLLAVSGATALAGTPPLTGSFAFEDQFVVQPGEPASCAFPVLADLQKRGTYQIFLGDQTTPARILLHETWTGTLSANGKYVIERAAQNDIVDANAGQIHDQIPFGGILIHDVGLLRFDANGELTFEAGPHQGFDGDVAAVERLCAALS